MNKNMIERLKNWNIFKNIFEEISLNVRYFLNIYLDISLKLIFSINKLIIILIEFFNVTIFVCTLPIKFYCYKK